MKKAKATLTGMLALSRLQHCTAPGAPSEFSPVYVFNLGLIGTLTWRASGG